jgi:hypothetical protein
MTRLLTILFLLLPLASSAQISISGGVLYGTWNMASMKSIQQDVIASSQIPMKVVTEFPPYFGMSFNCMYALNQRTALGLAVDYYSTGGRVSYGDYSGYVQVDQLLSALSVGVVGRHQLNQSSSWPIVIGLQVSLVPTDAVIVIEEAIGTNVQNSSIELSTHNLGIRPTIGVKRNLPGGLFLLLQGGYEAQIHSVLRTSSGAETTVYAEWEGLRATMAIGWQIPSRKRASMNPIEQ